jgi:hypothetical protein
VLENLFGPDRSGVTININEDVLGVIDKMKLRLEAGFDQRKFDGYLQRAELEGAKYLEPFIEEAAPVLTGRLRDAVRYKAGKYKKPSAIVGINRGKGRSDMRGAYYARPVVSGTGDQWTYAGLKSQRGELRKRLKPILGGGRGGVQKATALLQEYGYYSTYTRTPLEARPFVEETAQEHLEDVKRVVSDTIDRILQDEVFRDSIKIRKG